MRLAKRRNQGACLKPQLVLRLDEGDEVLLQRALRLTAIALEVLELCVDLRQ